VLGDAVVPEAEVAGTPVVAHGELRLGGVYVEVREQRVALAAVQLFDVRGEPGVDEERLATGLGMGTDHGVLDRFQRRVHLSFPLASAVFAGLQCLGEDRGSVVHGRERFEEALSGSLSAS
jgi:hypothetical protein